MRSFSWRPWGLVFFIFYFFIQASYSQEVVSGQVRLESQCGGQAMVWLSHEGPEKSEELLIHTLVPDFGTYAFSVSPGTYQVWVTSPQGCESEFKALKVESGQNVKLDIRLEK